MDESTYISLCLKSGNIRIFKKAIRFMDNPKFIRFSINEEGTLLAVEPYYKRTLTSFKVPSDLYSDNGSMRVYSKKLCSIIYREMKWDENKLYRVPGRIISKDKIGIFDLKKAECYNDETFKE